MNSDVNTIFKVYARLAPITVGSSPYIICVDRNGIVWIVNQGGNSITKLVNGVVDATIATTIPAPPYGMCVDKNNKLWITDIAMGKIHSIENSVVSTGISVCNNPYAICVDKNNAIWVTSVSSRTVVKIVDGVVAASITVGNAPQSICVDKDNSVFVANKSDGTVSKIVNDVVVATITVGNGPMGICIDKNNAVWVANSNSVWATDSGDGTASKIINDVVVATIPTGKISRGICVDNDNAIFVSNSGDGTIAKIVNDVVVEIIPAGVSPSLLGDATGMQAELLFNSGPTLITVLVNVDTLRAVVNSTPIPVIIKIDLYRVVGNNVTINMDTFRNVSKIQICNLDTKRILAQNITPNFSQSDIGLKSISIQTGVQSLSDRFTLETVGKTFSDTDNFTGEVIGFSFSFEKAETRESITSMGTTYTVTGRPDMNNFLFGSVYMIRGSSLYNGGRVINATAKSLCAAIGVDATNITDFIPLGIGSLDEDTKIFKIKEKSKKAFLDKLFGWSSEFAHRQIYYTNRNGKVVVNEVGRHTTVYDLNDQSKYKIENINTQRQRIRKFVDVSESSDADPPKPTPGKSVTSINYTNSPFSGSAVFGDSSLVYASGLLIQEITTDSTTTYTYEPANSFAFNSSKNILRTKKTLSNDDAKRTITTYEYGIAIHGPYASSDVDVSLTSEHTIVEVKKDGSWEVTEEHKIYHVPLGNGFFGQRVVEISEDNHITVANSISRGSPGGLASMYTVQQYAGYTITPPDNAETPHDFIGELRYPVNIPVAEISIVNDLIGIINNMDNKIEETINLSIIVKPGATLVDAVKGAVTYKGNLYYIQTTSATINDRGTRQQISAIRWY